MSNQNENAASAENVEVDEEQSLRDRLAAIEGAKALETETFRSEIVEAIVGSVEAPKSVRKAGGMRLVLEIGFDSEGDMIVTIASGAAPKVAKSGLDMRADYKAVDGHTERGNKNPLHFGLRTGMSVVDKEGHVLMILDETSGRGFGYGAREGSLSHLSLAAQGKLGKKGKDGRPLTTRGPEDWFAGSPKVMKGSVQFGTMERYETGSGHDYRVKIGN